MRELLPILLRRIPALAMVLLGTTIVTFLIMNFVPSDPARLIAGEHASPTVVAQIRERLGLDQPLWQQYFGYLDRLASGDFGTSIRSGRPVLEELLQALPATLELALAALIVIVVVGVGLGTLAAIRRDSFIDQSVRALGAIAISAPTFWTGILLLGVFFATLGWLPGGGRISVEYEQLPRVTGMLTVDAVLAANGAAFMDAVRHLALPASTLALASTGASVRLVRASVLEVMNDEHVRRARAAGLPEYVVITRYVLPTALLPFVTTLGLYMADLMSGAIVTEMIFGWPGLGTYAMEAIAGLDFAAIMGFTVLVALIYSIANLAVDLTLVALDPRARNSP